MTLSTSSPRAKRRWFALGFAVTVAMLIVGGAVLGLTSGTLTTAQMGGFGIEGNMIKDAAETYDWQNAGGDPAGPNACSALTYPGFVNVGGPLSLSCANDKPTGQTDNSLNGHEQDATVQSVCGSVPNNKSDLTNFYVGSQSVSAGYTTPQSFVYLGWTRVNTLGSADMDFEFNQAAQDTNLSATTCAAGNGTTISVQPNRTDGDLLVQYLFGGNSISIQLSTWITDNGTQGACATQTSAPCWGAPTDLTSAGTANGGINDASTPGSFSCLTPNNKTTTGCVLNKLSGGNLLPDTFGEAAVNLTAALSGSGCETFGSVYLKSRSSAVFTDALKDFIAPIPVHITNCVTPTLTTLLSSATASIGTSVTDTATLSGFLGSNPPGGTITFNVYTGATSDCTGTPTSIIAGSALAASGANATSSATITDGDDLSPGDYQVQAVYSGDGGSNLTSSSVCGTEPLTISKAQPTLSTQDSPTSNITVGTATSISDTATFGSLITGVAPTGSVNFTLYAGTTCVTAVTGVSGSGAIAGTGPYTATYSTTWTPTTTGTYTWGISYAGDTNYRPIPTSGTGVQCGGTGETFTVVARAPGLTTVQRVVPQDKVTFSGTNATAGDIKGSVIFRLYQDVGGAGTCGSTGGAKYTQTITGVNSATTLVYATSNSGDPATNSGFSITAPTGGSFKWTVEFLSSGNNNYSSLAESACASEPTTVSF